MTVLAVTLGGALGTLLRYAVGLLVVTSWPWATLGINVAGSFAAGFLVEWGFMRLSNAVNTAVTVGLLGGFTTYSAFATQSVLLAEEGRLGAAFAYTGASVLLGLCAAWLGVRTGAQVGP